MDSQIPIIAGAEILTVGKFLWSSRYSPALVRENRVTGGFGGRPRNAKLAVLGFAGKTSFESVERPVKHFAKNPALLIRKRR